MTDAIVLSVAADILRDRRTGESFTVRPVGRKLRDGLHAYVQVKLHRYDDDQPAGYWFADAVLMRMGYSQKVADSIIDRLARRDLIEWGVTKRTGWLTDEGILTARSQDAAR